MAGSTPAGYTPAVWVDADGCPVVNITIALCREYGVPCTLVCDTAHEFFRDGATTITVSKGADSADFALVSRVRRGDIVVTQDYGLAAMCLARAAVPLHQNGFLYTEHNIDRLLAERHAAKKARRAGQRLKGPHKRTAEEDAAFAAALRQLLAPLCSADKG